MCHSLPEIVHGQFNEKDHNPAKESAIKAILGRKRSFFLANFRQALRELSDDFDTSITDNLSSKSTDDFIIGVAKGNIFYCYPSKNIEYKIKGINIFLDNRAIGMIASRIALRNTMWSCGKTTKDYYGELNTGLIAASYKPLQSVLEEGIKHDLKFILDCTALLYYFETYLR